MIESAVAWLSSGGVSGWGEGGSVSETGSAGVIEAGGVVLEPWYDSGDGAEYGVGGVMSGDISVDPEGGSKAAKGSAEVPW